MLYGCKPVLPPVLYSLVADQDNVNPSVYLSKLTSTLIKLHTSAFINSEFNCKAAHNQLKAKENPYPIFQINDKLLYLSNHTGTCQVKFDTIWHGPFTIIDKVSLDTYSIKDQKSEDIVNHVHVKFLKMYRTVS